MVDFIIYLTDEEYKKCYDFAIESAKTQREYRSGGTQFRNLSMIQSDTQRGKVGEIVSKRFLEQSPFEIKEIKLDFDIYPRGEWDKQDFTLGGKSISIKSVKWFSNWLLIETKDIQRGDIYDFYILVTISKDFRSGTIKGYATKNDIVAINDKTQRLKKNEYIPGTQTKLDAPNYARHSKDLRNSIEDWEDFVKIIK